MNDDDWSNEVISNRVTVAKNTDSIKVSIKAPAFSKGNSVLALCITTVALAEVFLIYLMIKSNVSHVVIAASITLLAAGLVLVFGFVKLWLWHNFGAELINIKGDSLTMRRGYGMFSINSREVALENNTELLTNRFDSWSWREFRGKGVFRLATANTELADFGLKLDDQEYETIIGTITDELDRRKTPKTPSSSIDHVEDEAPKDQGADNTKAIEEKNDVEANGAVDVVESEEVTTEDNLEEEQASEEFEGEKVAPPVLQQLIGGHQHVAEGIQPPNLVRLTGGQHRAALNDYLRKPIRKSTTRNGRARKRA
jgi:hypothetical protein